VGVRRDWLTEARGCRVTAGDDGPILPTSVWSEPKLSLRELTIPPEQDDERRHRYKRDEGSRGNNQLARA
jgi:hypothetical protein